MKKFLTLSILIICFLNLKAFAQKVPVGLEPTKVISTHQNEVELGDWLAFSTTNDIYLNEKLYIKKNTPVYGFVSHIHENGWLTDYAEIKMEKFVTKNTKNKIVKINYPLTISGKTTDKEEPLKKGLLFIPRLIRGPEIFVEPDTQKFNIFIEEL